jgi:hypothetical protein
MLPNAFSSRCSFLQLVTIFTFPVLLIHQANFPNKQRFYSEGTYFKYWASRCILLLFFMSSQTKSHDKCSYMNRNTAQAVSHRNPTAPSCLSIIHSCGYPKLRNVWTLIFLHKTFIEQPIPNPNTVNGDISLSSFTNTHIITFSFYLCSEFLCLWTASVV